MQGERQGNRCHCRTGRPPGPSFGTVGGWSIPPSRSPPASGPSPSWAGGPRGSPPPPGDVVAHPVRQQPHPPERHRGLRSVTLTVAADGRTGPGGHHADRRRRASPTWSSGRWRRPPCARPTRSSPGSPRPAEVAPGRALGRRHRGRHARPAGGGGRRVRGGGGWAGDGGLLLDQRVHARPDLDDRPAGDGRASEAQVDGIARAGNRRPVRTATTRRTATPSGRRSAWPTWTARPAAPGRPPRRGTAATRWRWSPAATRWCSNRGPWPRRCCSRR